MDRQVATESEAIGAARFPVACIKTTLLMESASNHAMELTASGCYNLPFCGSDPYSDAMLILARGSSSLSR
jgi:hypothetical protein